MRSHKGLTVWKHPDSYGGFSPDGDYLVISRTRDSTILDQSNWDYIAEKLGARPFDDGSYTNEGNKNESRPEVYHWRAGHCACGWVEYMMIRADAKPAIIAQAEEIQKRLSDYPVLDESDYSDRQYNAVYEYWAEMSDNEKLEMAKEHGFEGEAVEDIPKAVFDDLIQSEMFF